MFKLKLEKNCRAWREKIQGVGLGGANTKR